MTSQNPSWLSRTYARLRGRDPVLESMEGMERIPAQSLATYQELQARRAQAGRLAPWQTNQPQYPKLNSSTFIHEGYRKNAIIRASIDMIARNVDNTRFRVIGSDRKEIEDHPLVAAAQVPTNGATQKERWRRVIQDLYLTGNAVWEKVRRKDGAGVAEMWRLDPLQIRIEPSATKFIEKYWYFVAGKWHPIDPANIVHWKFPDPIDPGYFGIPPLLSAARDMAVDNTLTDSMKVTLQNQATPATVLTMPPNTTIDEDAAEETRRKFRARTSGDRLGDVAVVDGGVTVDVIGMSWKDMDLGNVISVPETRIASVHGTPMILLGRGGSNGDPTHSNYEQARSQFWGDTMLPLLCMLAEVASVQLLPDFRGSAAGDECEFDTASVPSLQADKIARLKDASAVFALGGISSYVMQQLGGVETHGEDVFHIPTSVDQIVPVGERADTPEEV